MSQVISKDGTSIAYDKTGIGPSVLLVDGAVELQAILEPPSAYGADIVADPNSDKLFDYVLRVIALRGAGASRTASSRWRSPRAASRSRSRARRSA